jgi:hypothetical protein
MPDGRSGDFKNAGKKEREKVASILGNASGLVRPQPYVIN